MELNGELVGARPGPDLRIAGKATSVVHPNGTAVAPTVTRAPAGTAPAEKARPSRLRGLAEELRWPALTYFGTRVALFAIAWLCDLAFSFVPGNSLVSELSNWDGRWYVRLTTLGYLQHMPPPSEQTTLGFFPLYPMTMWLVAHIFVASYVVAGVAISIVGGFVATVLVQRLARDWWGPETARKAVLFFCLFPGSVVFSMVYSEGILIPLIAGCLYALDRRRYVTAGVLAAFATAIGPDALALLPACAAASYVELRRHGWRDQRARRSLVAPLLTPLGAVAFAGFLWAWVGTPFASYLAQHDAWHEKTNPLALPHQLWLLLREIGWHFSFYRINVNYISGLVGTVFLVFGLRYLWRDRKVLPVHMLAFVAAMTFLVVTSWNVPPNPRMLITAFPVVIVFAKWLHGVAWRRLIWISSALFVAMSCLTFVGAVLRP